MTHGFNTHRVLSGSDILLFLNRYRDLDTILSSITVIHSFEVNIKRCNVDRFDLFDVCRPITHNIMSRPFSSFEIYLYHITVTKLSVFCSELCKLRICLGQAVSHTCGCLSFRFYFNIILCYILFGVNVLSLVRRVFKISL